MARIAVGGFQHETNTFAPVKATLETFEEPDGWPGLTRGMALFDVFTGINIPLAGFLDQIDGRAHSVHFRADFAPLASDIQIVVAPGPNAADPARLLYRKLRSNIRRGIA